VAVGEEEIRVVNIWDFGGQEIMHATHEFFLTTRTLYVLVLDGQADEAGNRLEYWLRLIEAFGKGSPVIVVRNKVDLEQRLELGLAELGERYPSIKIKAFVETSCKMGQGIDGLKGEIRRLIDAACARFDSC
jgi:small GTP-binding protein